MTTGMSTGTRYVDWAFSLRTLTPMEQLVLLRLAHYADHLKVCRPSVNRLIEETGVSRATLYRSLASLEDQGILERTVGAKTTTYLLHKRRRSMLPQDDQGGLTVRQKGGSQKETRLTMRPEPYSSSKRTKVLDPSDQGPYRPRSTKATSKLKQKSQVSTSGSTEPRPAVVRGWEALRAAVADSRSRTPGAQKESTMAMPGFEDETPKRKTKTRGFVDETEGLAVTGKLEEPKRESKAKPVEQWKAPDFQRYIARLAREKAPDLREQVPTGWALGDFSKWLKQGTPAEVIHRTIEDFFADESNFLRTDSKLTIWQRYRIHFVHNQQEVLERYRNRREDELIASSTPRETHDDSPSMSPEEIREYHRKHEEQLAEHKRRKAEEAAERARLAAEREAEEERLAEIEIERMLSSWGK